VAGGTQAYIGRMDQVIAQSSLTLSQPSLTLSPSAAARVAAIADKQGKPAILRLAVDGGGCSGFQYRFGMEDTPAADDLVAGCIVDYVESLGGAAFKVENPNATAGCGCGSSFAI